MTLASPLLVHTVQTQLPGLRSQPWLPLHGGRTNRLWRVGQAVVKSYDPLAASPLFPNDPAAEARALAILSPLNIAPPLLGTGDGWLAYSYVQGRVWQDDPRAAAAALFRLHQVCPTGFRLAATGSAAILAQARTIAAGCSGSLPPAPPDPSVPPVRRRRLIHGDAVPGNLIDSAHGVTLIDWQCPALGDPTEDLATFLSPAMQWLYRGAVLTEQDKEDFLQAYPDTAVVQRYRELALVYRWRMAAHCQWKAERGEQDYARALTLELMA